MGYRSQRRRAGPVPIRIAGQPSDAPCPRTPGSAETSPNSDRHGPRHPDTNPHVRRQAADKGMMS